MYRMKRETGIIIVLFIAIMIITVWFSGSYAYVPYTSTLALNQAKFEGFTNRFNPLEYSTLANESAADDTYLNFSINKSTQDCKKVDGFNGFGVFCHPESKYGEKIDIFSDAKGSIQCGGNGYNNSQGGLCLDKKMVYELQTRGGNSTGVPSTIAGASA